jgi:hypothetical protein
MWNATNPGTIVHIQIFKTHLNMELHSSMLPILPPFDSQNLDNGVANTLSNNMESRADLSRHLGHHEEQSALQDDLFLPPYS